MQLEPLHVYLRGDCGCENSFIVRVMPQSLTLSYVNTFLENQKYCS